MTQLAQASFYNVEATLNAWMQTALQAFSLPAWLATLPTIIPDMPQTNAVMPCFSLCHIPIGTDALWEGNLAGTGKGIWARGILDVSCWVSRSKSPDWLAQLRTMRDMALSVGTASPVVVISDYAALPYNSVAPAITTTALVGTLIAGDDGTWTDTPQTTAYKINITGAALTPTEADPNPDVERARVLVDYNFVFRAN